MVGLARSPTKPFTASTRISPPKPAAAAAATTVPPARSASRGRLHTPHVTGVSLSLDHYERPGSSKLPPLAGSSSSNLPDHDSPMFLPSRGFGAPTEPLRVAPLWPPSAATLRQPAPARLIPHGKFLRAQTPKYYAIPQHISSSVDEFESEHRTLVHTACDSYRRRFTPSGAESEVNNEHKWQVSMWELRWSRFVGDARPPSPPPALPKKRKKKAPQVRQKTPFSLEATFWDARRDCDSEGLYDSDECYSKMVALDWARAIEDGRLARLVSRTESKSGGDDDDDDGNELQDIEAVWCLHAPLIYNLYDEYCLYGGTDEDDIFSMPKKGYSLLVDDLQLDVKESKTCRLADLDTLFIEVNNASMRHAKELEKEASKSLRAQTNTAAQLAQVERLKDTGLSRPEFLAVLASIAIKRFVETRQLKDVSEALDRLITHVIAPRLPPHISEARNGVRRRSCYREGIVKAMLPKVSILRQAFNAYAPMSRKRLGVSTKDQKKEESLLSPSEFIQLCRDLLPGDCYEYLSERDLQRTFLKSRMRVIDPVHGKRRVRFRHLNFEDFVEACIRVSLLAPVPTNARDLAEFGVSSALEWYEEVLDPEADSREVWQAFLAAHCHGTEGVDLVDELRERDPSGQELAARVAILADHFQKRVKELKAISAIE